jgi:hypothetical protein
MNQMSISTNNADMLRPKIWKFEIMLDCKELNNNQKQGAMSMK